MPSLPFKKIDAFTRGASPGNPAGAVYLRREGELSPGQMQKIALELKGWVSEVGFVAERERGSYWLRYYSSEREVAFCGHATVGIVYDLIKSNNDLAKENVIKLSTAVSDVEAFNHIEAEDSVYISAPPAIYKACNVTDSACAKALRVDRSGTVRPRAVINAGLDTLIVEVDSIEATLSLSPNIEELKSFCVVNEIDIILVYTNEVSKEGSAYRTRVFAPRFGYLEDPATGSGSSAFGYFLQQNNKWLAGTLTLEQSGSRDSPNYVKLKSHADPGGRIGVLFGGSATVKVRGDYIL